MEIDLRIFEEDSFPFVTSRTSDKSGVCFQYIQSRNVLINTVENQVHGNELDWDSMALCSPVLEAWGRWNPEVKSSRRQFLSKFSNEKPAIAQLTNYMQGHVIKITEKDLYKLLLLADMLQVNDVYKYCRYRVANLPLNKDNYHKILNTCTVYGFEHEQMDQFIRGNLTVLCKEKGISTISSDAVEFLLTDVELSYWPMEERFLFINDWCKAYEGRSAYFEKWFDCLDLNKIEKYFIEAVVSNANLVRISAKCLNKINVHLCDRQEKPVPFFFTSNDVGTGSNVIAFNLEDKQVYKFKLPHQMMTRSDLTAGFNLEDRQLYKFKLPDQMMTGSNLTTVCDSGQFVSFDRSHGCVYEYDINANIFKKKKVLSQGRYPENISHMLYANDRLIFIDMPIHFQVRNVLRPRGFTRGSVLYEQVYSDETTVKIEPLLTLTFEVSCACFSRSAVVMKPTTYPKNTILFFYNLVTNQLSAIGPEKDGYGIFEPSLQCMLPVHENVLSIFQETRFLLSKNGEKHSYIIEDRHLRSTYELKQLNFERKWPVSYAYHSRTRSFCHIKCPHCDLIAVCKKKEKKKKKKKKKKKNPGFMNS